VDSAPERAHLGHVAVVLVDDEAQALLFGPSGEGSRVREVDRERFLYDDVLARVQRLGTQRGVQWGWDHEDAGIEVQGRGRRADRSEAALRRESHTFGRALQVLGPRIDDAGQRPIRGLRDGAQPVEPNAARRDSNLHDTSPHDFSSCLLRPAISPTNNYT